MTDVERLITELEISIRQASVLRTESVLVRAPVAREIMEELHRLRDLEK